MSQLPVTAQGETGLCYAYTAAQLADAYLAREGKLNNHKTLAIAAGIQSKGVSLENILISIFNPGYMDDPNGGFVCNAFDQINKNGACNEVKLNKAMEKLFGIASPQATIEVRDVDFHLHFLNSLFKNKDSDDMIPYKNLSGDCIEASASSMNLDAQTKKLLLPLFKALIFSLKEDSRINSMKAFVKKFCENHKLDMPEKLTCLTHTDYEVVGQDVFNNDIVMGPVERIHDLFNKPKDKVLPVGIEYCSAFLEYGGSNADGLFDMINKNKCKPHASLIMGRRSRNGKCEFLLRNSWGKNCAYDDKFDCEEGNIWIEDKVLKKNLMNLVHLE